MSNFFFFQAEDGIRDGHVTGVQTCALPIYPGDSTDPRFNSSFHGSHVAGTIAAATNNNEGVAGRSEERRVGKECRARRTGDHDKEEREITQTTRKLAQSEYPRAEEQQS